MAEAPLLLSCWLDREGLPKLASADLVQCMSVAKLIHDLALVEAERRGLAYEMDNGVCCIPYNKPDGFAWPTTLLDRDGAGSWQPTH